MGKGASAGAVAGLVSGLAHGLLYGLIPLIISVVRFPEDGPEATLRREFPQLLRVMRAAWRVGDGAAAAWIVWCGSAIIVASALGAAGGAIFSSLQRERPAPTAGPDAGE